MGLEQRSNQVLNESIGTVPTKEHYPTRFTIQEHDAKKAGKHFDYRLVLDGKAYSWASRYLPPKTTVDRFYLIRQPEHEESYIDWSGTIPGGEYGAGKVTVIYDINALVIKSSDDNIKLSIPDGDLKGIYSFLHKDGNNWLVVRNREMEYSFEDKKSYKTKIHEDLWNDDDFIASEKLDGASVIAHVNAGRGIGIVSQRKSVNDELIKKDNAVPHISYIKPDKQYDGMVFRGELYLDNQPFSVLSGILNSKSTKAVKAQDSLGEKIKLAPFEILKLPGGKDPSSMNYIERLKFLEEFVRDLNSKHINVPKHTIKNKKGFYEDIISNGGEGVVLRHIDQPDFYKVKKEETYTLRIVDYTQGEGKYLNKGIGAFIVEDSAGRRVGRVGTGLDDATRIDAYKNFAKYKGRLIKVKAMEPTAQSFRSPVFVGWETDKHEADMMPF